MNFISSEAVCVFILLALVRTLYFVAISTIQNRIRNCSTALHELKHIIEVYKRMTCFVRYKVTFYFYDLI